MPALASKAIASLMNQSVHESIGLIREFHETLTDYARRRIAPWTLGEIGSCHDRVVKYQVSQFAEAVLLGELNWIYITHFDAFTSRTAPCPGNMNKSSGQQISSESKNSPASIIKSLFDGPLAVVGYFGERRNLFWVLLSLKLGQGGRSFRSALLGGDS